MLRDQLEMKERVELIQYTDDPSEMMLNVARCSAFIGMRYHSCVFAYLAGIPLIIISYFEKCQALAADIGLPDNAIISIENILEGKFEGCVRDLHNNPKKFIATLSMDTAKARAMKNFPSETT